MAIFWEARPSMERGSSKPSARSSGGGFQGCGGCVPEVPSSRSAGVAVSIRRLIKTAPTGSRRQPRHNRRLCLPTRRARWISGGRKALPPRPGDARDGPPRRRSRARKSAAPASVSALAEGSAPLGDAQIPFGSALGQGRPRGGAWMLDPKISRGRRKGVPGPPLGPEADPGAAPNRREGARQPLRSGRVRDVPGRLRAERAGGPPTRRVEPALVRREIRVGPPASGTGTTRDRGGNAP